MFPSRQAYYQEVLKTKYFNLKKEHFSALEQLINDRELFTSELGEFVNSEIAGKNDENDENN